MSVPAAAGGAGWVDPQIPALHRIAALRRSPYVYVAYEEYVRYVRRIARDIYVRVRTAAIGRVLASFSRLMRPRAYVTDISLAGMHCIIGEII